MQPDGVVQLVEPVARDVAGHPTDAHGCGATVTHVTDPADVPPEIVAKLGAICLALPETYEEAAWVGTRWRIRQRTIAHVLTIDAGWPPVYARAAGTDGPVTVMTFRSSGPELEVLRASGHPFFSAAFGRDDVGLVLDSDTDWDEVAELITESYCVLAPKKLAEAVDRPAASSAN